MKKNWWEEIKDIEMMERELRLLRKKTIWRPEIKWAVHYFVLSKDFMKQWLSENELFKKDFENYMRIRFMASKSHFEGKENLKANFITYIKECNPSKEIKQIAEKYL